jgi:EAL domain-containing protein (putative c-di-GMP-specific phosphodiesterase class I)
MLSDKADYAIVKAIIDLAREIGITVIAEGVETEDQAMLLARLRCDVMQGFYFDRPMPPERAARRLQPVSHPNAHRPVLPPNATAIAHTERPAVGSR